MCLNLQIKSLIRILNETLSIYDYLRNIKEISFTSFSHFLSCFAFKFSSLSFSMPFPLPLSLSWADIDLKFQLLFVAATTSTTTTTEAATTRAATAGAAFLAVVAAVSQAATSIWQFYEHKWHFVNVIVTLPRPLFTGTEHSSTPTQPAAFISMP